MIINEVVFSGSYIYESQCPQKWLPEYAFIGRSNVGKSSLINLLTNRNDLAKVSKQPGKTTTINYFLVNQTWNLVDLPGYGYARRSKSMRQKWSKMIKNYLRVRKQLVNLFVLVDANLPLQKLDLDFMIFLGEEEIPFSIVFTKIDKSKPRELKKNLQRYRQQLLTYWSSLPPQFETSKVTRVGHDAILDYIAELNLAFEKKR